jgi:SAM-dependent methyltransferase
MSPPPRFSPDDEEAGAREPFEDAALYDFEYRRRRADVNFYRRLAEERRTDKGAAPILDLACGTGRLLVPLLRDGHTVVGLDRSATMLARAARRVHRLAATRRARALLVRGDLRAFSFTPRFGLAICAFHSVQHLVDDRDLIGFFRRVRAALVPGGWFAFDVLPPSPAWLARDPNRRWARTTFHHPETGERLVYTLSQSYEPRRKALHMRFHYQPVDERGRPSGAERLVRLCHRQLPPEDVRRLLSRAGLEIVASFGGFDARPLAPDDDQHVYVARRRPITREKTPRHRRRTAKNRVREFA